MMRSLREEWDGIVGGGERRGSGEKGREENGEKASRDWRFFYRLPAIQHCPRHPAAPCFRSLSDAHLTTHTKGHYYHYAHYKVFYAEC